MEPGSSAIIAIAEDQVLDQLERGIAGYDRIARHAVSAEAVLAITAQGLETDEPADAEPEQAEGSKPDEAKGEGADEASA